MTTEYTFDSESLSDLFKDAHGFRPTSKYFENWKLMDDDEKQAEWDKLIVILEYENETQQKYEELQVKEFKALVAEIIKAGAKNESTAYRWLMDAAEWCNRDWENLAWKHGLPYSYFNGKV